MSRKYPECETCYFNNRAPQVCESCYDANQYEPEEFNDDYDDDESFQMSSRKTISLIPV